MRRPGNRLDAEIASASWSVFANGVDQEAESDAAIPPNRGPRARGLCVAGVERMAAHN
jgi:hypothetical protein